MNISIKSVLMTVLSIVAFAVVAPGADASLMIVPFGPPAVGDSAPPASPTPVYQPSPEYPAEALKAGLEGIVWVKGLVGIEGEMSQLEVVTTDCEACGFEDAALKTAKQYKFEPALSDGQPVTSWVSFKIEFRLP
jgi:TonB family protein